MWIVYISKLTKIKKLKKKKWPSVFCIWHICPVPPDFARMPYIFGLQSFYTKIRSQHLKSKWAAGSTVTFGSHHRLVSFIYYPTTGKMPWSLKTFRPQGLSLFLLSSAIICWKSLLKCHVRITCSYGLYKICYCQTVNVPLMIVNLHI